MELNRVQIFKVKYKVSFSLKIFASLKRTLTGGEGNGMGQKE